MLRYKIHMFHMTRCAWKMRWHGEVWGRHRGRLGEAWDGEAQEDLQAHHFRLEPTDCPHPVAFHDGYPRTYSNTQPE